MSAIAEEYEISGGSRILLPTFVDAGTVSASSAAASAPASNLQNKYRGKVWRATGCAAEHVDVNFGQERPINAVALVNHNLSYDAELTIALGSSQGASDVGSGDFPAHMPLFGWNKDGWNEHGWGGFPSTVEEGRLYWTGFLRIIYFEAALSARWLRVAIADPDNEDGYVALGRLLAGSYIGSTCGPSRGMGNRPVDPSTISYSLGGQSSKDEMPPYREAVYEFAHTPGDETFAAWFDFLRQIGTGEPFVGDFLPYISDPDARLNNLLYCELPADSIQPVRIGAGLYGAVSLQIRESL